MVPVPWFDSRAAFSIRPRSLPSGRPWSDGPSRLWLRRSEKSDEQGSYVPRSERRRSESEVGLGAGLPIGEAVRRRLEPDRALRSDRWAEVADERALLFLGQAFRSVAGPPLCPVVF